MCVWRAHVSMCGIWIPFLLIYSHIVCKLAQNWIKNKFNFKLRLKLRTNNIYTYTIATATETNKRCHRVHHPYREFWRRSTFGWNIRKWSCSEPMNPFWAYSCGASITRWVTYANVHMLNCILWYWAHSGHSIQTITIDLIHFRLSFSQCHQMNR